MTVINIVELHWQSEGLGLDDRCSSHVLISLDASNIHLHRHQARRYLRELRIRFLCCAHWREYYIFVVVFVTNIRNRSEHKEKRNQRTNRASALSASLSLSHSPSRSSDMHAFFVWSFLYFWYRRAEIFRCDRNEKWCIRQNMCARIATAAMRAINVSANPRKDH